MKRTLVSFDWAIKRLLRQKANFDILEGFLSELLMQEVVIHSLLESESNKIDESDRHNQLDLLCENDRGELIIIEVQYYSEVDYFQRMLFGTSKVITEYISAGEPYAQVRKVYSVNILYFDLGQGEDYLYRGTMEFKGLNFRDALNLSSSQMRHFQRETPGELYPEYYLIKVNNFDDVAKSSLDEWVYYLKNSKLPRTYQAKGLDKVEQRLKYDKMDATRKQEYDQHLESLQISKSMIETAKLEGRQEGNLENKLQVIFSSFREGIEIPLIAKIVSMTEEEVVKVLKNEGLL